MDDERFAQAEDWHMGFFTATPFSRLHPGHENYRRAEVLLKEIQARANGGSEWHQRVLAYMLQERLK